MRQDYTDITMVVDRSGSMASCQASAQEGINKFLEAQRKQEGKVTLTLVQFDTKYDVVHDGVDIETEPSYELVPRGGTALYDAIGTAINTTGKRLSEMEEKERPGLVIFMIVTDGYENSSQEFSGEKIKEMIEHQESKYGWNFEYLGANQDAIATAGGIGISATKAATYATQNSADAYVAVSAKVGRMRNMVMGPEGPSGPAGPMGQSLNVDYTEEERTSMTASK